MKNVNEILDEVIRQKLQIDNPDELALGKEEYEVLKNSIYVDRDIKTGDLYLYRLRIKKLKFRNSYIKVRRNTLFSKWFPE